MEFVYGTERNTEVLKTKSINQEELNGFQTIETKYPDQVITDTFCVVKKIREKQDSEGNFYKWYEIDHHNRVIDKTPLLKKVTDKSTANIDYLSMMTGIELPDTPEV